MPYDNMPFSNKQAAKSDRYGKLTAARKELVSNYNAAKATPEGAKAYKNKLNELDQARYKANPNRFKADMSEALKGRTKVEVNIGGKKTSMPDLSRDNETGSKKRTY